MKKIPSQAKRKQRIRSRLHKVASTAGRPRLTVFRSNAHIWAQIIDDAKGVTLVASNDKTLEGVKGTKLEKAAAVGADLAEKAKKSKVTKVIFDRGPYKFHGRVKALADAAREKGLEF